MTETLDFIPTLRFFEVSTLDAKGNVLADLYAGHDREEYKRAVQRGMAAVADPNSTVARVRAFGPAI